MALIRRQSTALPRTPTHRLLSPISCQSRSCYATYGPPPTPPNKSEDRTRKPANIKSRKTDANRGAKSTVEAAENESEKDLKDASTKEPTGLEAQMLEWARREMRKPGERAEWLREFKPLTEEETDVVSDMIPHGLFREFSRTVGVHPDFAVLLRAMRSWSIPPVVRTFRGVRHTMYAYSDCVEYLNQQEQRSPGLDQVKMARKRDEELNDRKDGEEEGEKKPQAKEKKEDTSPDLHGKEAKSSSGKGSEPPKFGQGEEGETEGPDGSGPGKGQFRGITMTDVLVGAIVWFIIWPLVDGMLFGESREITWQEVRRMFLDKGLVERFIVQEGTVVVQLNKEATAAVYQGNEGIQPNTQYFFTIGSVEGFENRLDEAQNDLGIPPSQRIPVKYGGKSPWLTLLLGFGPTLLLIGLLVYSTRQIGGRGGNQMFGFGKSTAKKFNHESAVKVKFTDVAGMDEAKMEIMEFVSFLKTPEKFRKLGAKIPRGAILAGPPGTGKTLLAKATAGECQVPFFSVSGSEFVEMFVGVGPSRVRDLFATARKNAPCIIFIDEIDAIGRARFNRVSGGNDEREATLNQILTEMDGFNTTEQVVVLAGTNRADVLDQALLRPGRFDRHIFVDRPTQKGREDIFRVHLQKIVTADDKEKLLGRLATLTPGFSGADIAHVVNEAALIGTYRHVMKALVPTEQLANPLSAARYNADAVLVSHFEQAIERTIAGLEKKSLVLRPEEKKTVAYHEAGHAICGWFLKDADPLLKVSIIPRGQGALGYAQYLPQDAYLMSTSQLMDRMAMTLGGRVSEELHFDVVTTGASDDFKKVTRLATNMVTQWGMSEKVGPIHFDDDEQKVQKPFAEETGRTIDAEVRRIVDEAYKMSKDLLTARKREVGLVAEELLKKEMLTRDDLVRILGPRPFSDNHQAFEKYFGGDQQFEQGKGKEGGGKKEALPPSFPPEETDTPPSTS